MSEEKKVNKKMIPTAEAEVRSYTKRELCSLFGISNKILRKWLSDHKEFFANKFAKTLSAKQIEFIFSEFGIPKKLNL